MKDTYRAVLFDMDGVLLDTMPMHAKAWLKTARKWHLPVSSQEIYQWEGEPGLATARRLLRRQAQWGGEGPPDWHQLLREKENHFTAFSKRIRIDPMWRTFLDRLKQRSLRTALVTGTSRNEVKRIVPHSIFRRFDTVITGDAVRNGKPHPEPYQTALRRLRLTPAQAIVIENAPNGIRSAKRARIGLIIALTSSFPAVKLKQAHVVVRTLTQMRRTLETAAMQLY